MRVLDCEKREVLFAEFDSAFFSRLEGDALADADRLHLSIHLFRVCREFHLVDKRDAGIELTLYLTLRMVCELHLYANVRQSAVAYGRAYERILYSDLVGSVKGNFLVDTHISVPNCRSAVPTA